MESTVQMKMIRPPRANRDLYISLLKGEKHDPRGNMTNTDSDGDGYFAADCRAKKLLTNSDIEIPNKVQEDLKKVLKIFKNKVIKGKKQKIVKIPIERSNLKGKSKAISKPKTTYEHQHAASEMSLSESITPNDKFTTLLSPCYGPLKKLQKNPEESEFRYIFKRYYKELPVFQPRATKDRLTSTVEPVSETVEPSSLPEKRKPRNHKKPSTNNRNLPDNKLYMEHEWKEIRGVDIVERLVDILCDFQEETHLRSNSNNFNSTGFPAATSAPTGIGLGAGTGGGVPTISRPASAMQRQISSNINLHLGSSTTNQSTNIVSIESMFSAGKHLPSSTLQSSTSVPSSNNKPPLPHLSHSQRPKSAVSTFPSEGRKAVVQRAILTRTDPAKTWTIPDEYK